MIACQVHRSHRPRLLRTVQHHILPKGMGGQTVRENMVVVCDSGHANIHRLLDQLLRGEALSRHDGHPEERRIAQSGYDQWIAAGKPGKPVYQLRPEVNEDGEEAS